MKPRCVPILNPASALAAVLCVGVLLTASRAAAALPSAWQVTPYRVQVLVAAAPLLQLPPTVQSQLSTDLAARIDGLVGAAWQTTVAPAPARLTRDMTADINRVSAEAIPAASLEFDKVMLVAIVPDGPGFRVSARDFDVRTRMFSEPVVRPVSQVGMLRDAMMDAIFAAFAPLARIEHSDKDSAVVTLKAAALPMRDPNLTFLHEGDTMRPIMRHSDRDGKLRKALPVAWTFCTVRKIDADEVQCQVVSGLRAALAAKGRGRIEALALRIVPPHGSTTLVLQSRTAPRQPLAGYDVYARLPSEKTATTLLGRTDRLGRLVVPPGESPIRVLLIRNGNELLARLPVMPGLEPQAVADIANDDRRLEAEGFIVGLQEELVDMVTRREVLLTRIKARLKANQVEKAAAMFDELRRMPSAKQFTMRLDNAEKALASNDPVVQKKIDALLTDTRKLFDQHLNSLGIDEAEKAIEHAKEGKEKDAESSEEKEEK